MSRTLKRFEDYLTAEKRIKIGSIFITRYERSRIIGKAARNHVKSTFGVENWVNMQLEIYEKVINGRGAKTNFVMRKINKRNKEILF